MREASSVIKGVAFRAEITRDRLRIWVRGGKKSIIKVSSIQSVRIERDGSTKLRLKFSKDLIVPTTTREAGQLVRVLKALIGARRIAEQTKKLADSREAKRQKPVRRDVERQKQYYEFQSWGVPG